MAPKEFQIVTPGCGCCCGPCRDQSPFGHADRIQWYQYALPIGSPYQIDNYAVKGVGSEYFVRNYTSRRFCNNHIWNPDVCQYQLTPTGNPTVSTYHPYHKVNVGPRMYEQKWTFDSVQKSWVPLKSDGTAWPQGLQVEVNDTGNPIYPLWYGQYPHLGYRLGSPDLPLIFESVFRPRPTPSAVGSPLALTDGYTTNDSRIVNRGWQTGPNGVQYYDMVAEGVVETSEGYYGPSSSWDRSCIRCPKMYRVTQKLIQHVVSADGLYDFEEVLYPVVEYPWSPLHNNSRAFSFSRYPGKTLFDANDVQSDLSHNQGVTAGFGSVAKPIQYPVEETYWNERFFGGPGTILGGNFRFNPVPFSYGQVGPPYIWNRAWGPGHPFEYLPYGYNDLGNFNSYLPDLGSHRIASPETGIQFSLDQRWRRGLGDTYGAWNSSSVLKPVPPFPEPPHIIYGGYSFPNYVGLGSVHPEYPIPGVQFRTLPPLDRWHREYLGSDSPPNILATLGRNRWTTINPVVYFFRDYLWIDGKYRLCDIMITEGNDDYQWTPPVGSTPLAISLSGFPFKNFDIAGNNNTISHLRYPVFQLSGPVGTFTFGGEIGEAVDSGPPLRYGDCVFPIPPVTSVDVSNGAYEITCIQLPAYRIEGGAWQDMCITGSWPRNFSAWGLGMTYLFQFTPGVLQVAGGPISTVGLPDANSHVYYQAQHPNGDYRIEDPNYVPFTGIKGGTRDINNIKMVGATVQVFGHPVQVAPPLGGWPLVATTTTDADGAWEVNVTPEHFYVVVDGRYENASGVDGDSTYYGSIGDAGFYTYPITPPVYERNWDIHIYQPRL